MPRRRRLTNPNIELLYIWYQMLLENAPRVIELTDRKMALHVRHRLYLVRAYDRETFTAVHGGDDAFPLTYLGISLEEKTITIDWDVLVKAQLVTKPIIDPAKAWEDCQIRMMRRREAELAKSKFVGLEYSDLIFPEDKKQ